MKIKSWLNYYFIKLFPIYNKKKKNYKNSLTIKNYRRIPIIISHTKFYIKCC